MAVALDHVTKRFGDVVAVDDLTVEVRDGELLALVGPSGSGKTTVLRLVAGLERPTAGDISIGGRHVTALPPRDRDVAMVFQNYALYPHLSVFGNLSFGLRLRGMRREEIAGRVEAVAALLALTTLVARRSKELSAGERQRVALGRALVREPKVLLLDEPLSNLEAPLRVRLRRALRELQDRLRTTTIYVTHDSEEAAAVADRIATLRKGALERLDTLRATATVPGDIVGEASRDDVTRALLAAARER